MAKEKEPKKKKKNWISFTEQGRRFASLDVERSRNSSLFIARQEFSQKGRTRIEVPSLEEPNRGVAFHSLTRPKEEKKLSLLCTKMSSKEGAKQKS